MHEGHPHGRPRSPLGRAQLVAAGWRLRRWASPVQPVVWLATGTPPGRIGYAPGPLRAVRRARHAGLRRPVRLCLLEPGPTRGPRFSPVTAYWVNERSRLVHAVVDDQPERADLVWVHAQDPLAPPVREQVSATLARLPPHVRVINPPDAYDAYHLRGTFPRLREAGVTVPDPAPRRGQLAVVKGPGQASRKSLVRFDGSLPAGHRAFGYVDARGPDGLHRRYRAFWWLDTAHPGDVLGARDWEVGLKAYAWHQPTFQLSDAEEQQIARIAEVLGLQWFCVDFVRRAEDGQPVFTDVNVYPTPVIAEAVDDLVGARGRWHFLDTAERLGVREPQDGFWPRFDAAVARFISAVPVPTR